MRISWLIPAVLMIASFHARAQCTPATINPSAALAVRPHMSPGSVSGLLGCAPSDVPAGATGIWIWAVPMTDKLGMQTQIAVAFDGSGALFAQFQEFPAATMPSANGALRVEPPPPMGNWVPSGAIGAK